MLHLFFGAKKFFPSEYKKTIYDIDFNKLYEDGKRYILTDLDNTLISYKETLPNQKLLDWKKEVEKIGYKIIVVSNSKKPRVSTFSEAYEVPYVHSSKKPTRSGIKKAMKHFNCSKNEAIFIGDQLPTDTLAANRAKLYNIVVDSISLKKPKWYTKLAKMFERGMRKKMIKKSKKQYEEMLLHEKI